MSIKIETHYEENVNLGNYQSAKVGLKIISDKVLENPAEVEKHTSSLITLAKQMVRNELEKVMDEKKKEMENKEE